MMAKWGKGVGNVGAALILAGVLGVCTAAALLGAAATVMAWRWFRMIVTF